MAEIATIGAAPVLARRAAGFAPSFWGQIEGLVGRHPDTVFFGGGSPARELMPVARLRAASIRAWADAPAALDYGEVAGYRPLRSTFAATRSPPPTSLALARDDRWLEPPWRRSRPRRAEHHPAPTGALRSGTCRAS